MAENIKSSNNNTILWFAASVIVASGALAVYTNISDKQEYDKSVDSRTPFKPIDLYPSHPVAANTTSDFKLKLSTVSKLGNTLTYDVTAMCINDKNPNDTNLKLLTDLWVGDPVLQMAGVTQKSLACINDHEVTKNDIPEVVATFEKVFKK